MANGELSLFADAKRLTYIGDRAAASELVRELGTSRRVAGRRAQASPARNTLRGISRFRVAGAKCLMAWPTGNVPWAKPRSLPEERQTATKPQDAEPDTKGSGHSASNRKEPQRKPLCAASHRTAPYSRSKFDEFIVTRMSLCRMERCSTVMGVPRRGTLDSCAGSCAADVRDTRIRR